MAVGHGKEESWGQAVEVSVSISWLAMRERK